MRRVMLYDRYDQPLGELSPDEVMSLVRHEEVNGAHTLTIRTTRVLEQGWRILTEDGMGKWREHVVYGTDATHSGGDTIGEYYCVWSIMHDLAGTTVSAMPGVQEPVRAALALDAVLGGTARWARGEVSNLAESGASMYDMDGWSAMKVLIDNWGGELDVTIEHGATGVTARKADLHLIQGATDAGRRYDFGADIKSVRRKLADRPLYCRISPRGKGVQTEGGGYGRKIRINDDAPSQPDWLEYAPMVPVAMLPDGNGGWEFPTLIVENSDCETPAELRAWGLLVLEELCTPDVTYDVDVVQASAEGIDMQGVALGDVVHLVDRKFGDGIRLSGRVASMDVDMLNERNVRVTIGSISNWLADTLSSLDGMFEAVRSNIQAVTEAQGHMATAQYIDELLERINAEIAAAGGFAYLVPGMGLLTYDIEVTDPTTGYNASTGEWASQVVQIKGGNISIASTRDSQHNWEFRTVLQSGFIVADLVTAAAITSGYIGSAGESYWDLDSGQLVIADPAIRAEIGSTGTVNSDVMWKRQAITTTYTETETHGFQITSKKSGGGWIGIFPSITDDLTGSGYHWGSIIGSGRLAIAAKGNDTASYGYVKLDTGSVTIGSGQLVSGTPTGALVVTSSKTSCGAFEASSVTASGDVVGKNVTATNNAGTARLTCDGYADLGYDTGSTIFVTIRSNAVCEKQLEVKNSLIVRGNLTVSGTKPRLCATENYGERLNYAYETPEPLFGDVGSGVIGEDGRCYVQIDAVFSETARTDMGYQVFLQRCGRGDLWVAEKHPTHFVVEGTPSLAFDWELKAHQKGYETLRMETPQLDEEMASEAELPEPRPDGWDVTAIEELYERDLLERSLYEAAV